MPPYQTARRASDMIDPGEEAHRSKPDEAANISTKRVVKKVKFIPPKPDLHGEEEDDEDEDDNGDHGESTKICHSSKENKTCPECAKPFPSFKSLYGHLKSHPDKGYRGASRPTALSKQDRSKDKFDKTSDLDNPPPPLRTTPRSNVTEVGFPGSSSHNKNQETTKINFGSDNPTLQAGPVSKQGPAYDYVVSGRRTKKAKEIEDEEYTAKELRAANTLMMMRRIIRGREGVNAVGSPRPEKKILATTSSTTPAAAKEGYRCNICQRSFPTHQALGGHRASHNNKHRSSSEAETPNGNEEIGDGVDSDSAAMARREHRCRECGETYGSGQALGGHKRRHYLPQGAEPAGRVVKRRAGYVTSPLSSAVAPASAVSARVADEAVMIDLNKPPSEC